MRTLRRFLLMRFLLLSVDAEIVMYDKVFRILHPNHGTATYIYPNIVVNAEILTISY